MATKKVAVVSFDPAQRIGYGGIQVRFSLAKPTPRHEVEFTTVPELLEKVKALGEAFGEGCSGHVRMKDNARNPPGFKEATRNLYYNLDAVPVED